MCPEKGKIMKARIISLLLLLAMTLTMFVACNEPEETTKGSGPSGGDVTTDKPWLMPDIGDTMGNGEKIKMLSQNRDWYYDELTIEADEIANVIDQTVYDRELYVEDYLKIELENEKITAEKYSTVSDRAKTLFDGGDDTYDIVMNSRTGGGNGPEIYYNLYEVENVDLTMPWYNQGWINANHDDIVTSICGDATLSLLRFTFVTMCNNTLLAQYGVTNIYDDVTNMTWTIDRQHEIVSTIYEDANQNGVSDEGDIFGFVTNTCTAVDPYFCAFDQPIVAKNDSGEFEFVFDVDKAVTATNKINNLFHNSNGTLILEHQPGTDGEYLIAYDGFASDLYAFATFRLIAVEEAAIIDMESPYGILPMPLLDEDQDHYGSYFHDMHSLIGIMGTVKEDRLPLVGAVLEVFSSYSYNSTRGIYLDTALKGRYFRDQQSRDVLDMVVASITVDPGAMYGDISGGLFGNYRTYTEGNTQNWANFVRSKQKIIATNLAKFNAGELH